MNIGVNDVSNMRAKQFLFFFLYLITLNLFSQLGQRNDGYDAMVISQSGINIRSEANLSSQVVVTAPFGAMVRRKFSVHVKDTIEGLPGSWIDVEYNGKSGFAFNSYLSQSIQDYHIGFEKGLPQFIYEGPIGCGEFMYFNRDLKWYGVYLKGPLGATSFEIKQVHPIIEPYFDNYEGYVMHRIKTGDTLRSEFLFGLPHEISDTTINQIKIPLIDYGNHQNHFLFPGMSIDVGYDKLTKTSYSVDVLGDVDSDSFVNHRNSNERPIINNYQLRLTSYSDNTIHSQNLNKEFDVRMNHDFIQILFAGDLNSDEKPDFIIRTQSTDVSESLTHLLMSGQSDEKIVDRVAQIYWGGCQ